MLVVRWWSSTATVSMQLPATFGCSSRFRTIQHGSLGEAHLFTCTSRRRLNSRCTRRFFSRSLRSADTPQTHTHTVLLLSCRNHTTFPVWTWQNDPLSAYWLWSECFTVITLVQRSSSFLRSSSQHTRWRNCPECPNFGCQGPAKSTRYILLLQELLCNHLLIWTRWSTASN